MKKEVVFQIQENSEHSTLEIEKPSITNVQPAFTFLNLLPSACSFRASAGSLWMQLTHFRIGAFFQYSVLLPSAKNDFLPLPGQAKWFSSIKCQTHNSLLAQSHLWLFQPDGCLPLRLLWHLWIKHSLLVVLCSRNAAKSFLTFPLWPIWTNITRSVCPSLLMIHACVAVTSLREGRLSCQILNRSQYAGSSFVCFNLKRMIYACGKDMAKAKVNNKIVTGCLF